MGVYIDNHIGPYMIVTGKKEETYQETKMACPNHKHLDQRNSKFCSLCGSPIVEVTQNKTHKLDPWSFVLEQEDFTDELYSPGMGNLSNILISNELHTKITLDSDSDSVVDLTNITDIQTKEIAEFKKKHSKIIDLLTENFDSVDFKWGIINYYS